jgi:hypothetical protein
VIPVGVRTQERDRVLRPVGGERVGAAKCRSERRQAEPRTELEHAGAAQVARADDSGQSQTARPELGPVGQELVVVEARLVDQLVCARRTKQCQRPAGELELELDQSAA